MNLIERIDKFNKSAKGKVLSSILVLLFSMVMVVTSCLAYAWFVYNRDVDSSNIQIAPSAVSVNATYNSYYIKDIDTKEVIHGTQTQNQQGQSTLEINMMPYDMTFTSTNQYAPVVVRVQIYDISTEYIPAANQTKYVSLVVTRNTSVSFTTSDELDEYFSSVGQVGCYANTSLSLSADEDDIYDAIIAQYRADQNVMKFTAQNNSVYTKVGVLDRSIAYTTANFKTDAQNKSCLVLYMCFDYNSALAQAFAQQETADLSNANSLENKFNIISDITSITVDF